MAEASPAERVAATDAPATTASSDGVTLALPALPEFGRLARIAAAGLALRNGFGYSRVEDLRIAIDEALILLLGYEAHPGRIVLDFNLEDSRMEIVARAEFDDPSPWDEDAEHRFEMLVTDILDRYELDQANGRITMFLDRESAADDA